MLSKFIFGCPGSDFEAIQPGEVQEGSIAQLDKFEKELIFEGKWKHPVKGFTLKVDKERLDKWVANFTKQQELNIKVPVPHGHNYKTTNNAGFIESVYTKQRPDGKWALFGQMEIPLADDRDRIGKTIKDVSVGIANIKHSDGNGEVLDLGECLEHVALTSYPVVSGMSDFVALDSAGETALSLVFDSVTEEAETLCFDTVTEKDLIQYAQQLNQQFEIGVPVPSVNVEGTTKVSHSACHYRSGNSTASCRNCLFWNYGGVEESPSCTYVEGPVRPVDLCDHFQRAYMYDATPSSPSSPSVPGEQEMTPEQLRGLEVKFGLEKNSLTSDNVYDKLSAVQLASKPATTDDEDAEGEMPTKKKGKPAMSQEDAFAALSSHPVFTSMQAQLDRFATDRAMDRHSTILAQAQSLIASGKMNKAIFDKLIGDERKTFSKDQCTETWMLGVEAQLQVLNMVPAAIVKPGRVTQASIDQLTFDQVEEDEPTDFAAMDKEIDSAIKGLGGVYTADQLAMNAAGLFEVSGK